MKGVVDLGGGIKGITAKNYIINGDLSFTQRGNYDLSPVTIDGQVFMADRFKSYCASNAATAQRKSTGLPNTNSYYSWNQTVTGNVSGVNFAKQIIEGLMITQLSNKVVTLSAWVKSNTNKTRILAYNNGNPSVIATTAHTGGGGWELLSCLFTMPSGITATNNLIIFIGEMTAANGAVSLVAGEYFEFTQVMLNEGSVAAPFSRAGGTYAGELELCQRYYEKSYAIDVAPGSVASNINGVVIMACGTPSANGYNGGFFQFVTKKRSGNGVVRLFSSNGAEGSLTYPNWGASPIHGVVAAQVYVSLTSINLLLANKYPNEVLEGNWTCDAEI